MFSATLQRRAGLQSSGDYTDYRKYAGRRLKKLRRREGLVTKSTKSYEAKQLKPGQWQHAMLQAERSWAAAMGARAALDADAAAPHTLRSQISAKLAKAAKHARHVLELEPTDMTEQEKLEFSVYASLISGELALEKQQWDTVATEFAKVRVGLIALSNQKAIGANEQNVFNDLLVTSVDPALRLVLVQQKQDAAKDLSQLARHIVKNSTSSEFAKLIAKVNPSALSDESAVNKLNEITFRSHRASVKYDALAEALLSVTSKEAELTSQLKRENNVTASDVDTSIFDEVLGEWDQVEFVTSNLINELNTAGKEREQDLDIISTYARFHLLYRRIQRDALVANKEAETTNAVRLYDVVLQSCDSMAELPGVYNDDELLEGIANMKQYFETKRSLTLASLYPEGSVEALALVNLAYNRLNESTQHSIAPSVDLPIGEAGTSQLKGVVADKLLKQYSLTIIYDEARNRSLTKGSTTSDLNFWQLESKHKRLLVADLEAKNIDPVPVKPVFYDVAFNHVMYNEENGSDVKKEPSQTAADEASNASNNTPKKKGLFGIF